MKNLSEDDNANVIVCFCEGWTVRKLLTAIKQLNLTNRFLIIGSDGWADRQDVVNEFEEQAVGSISIRIHSPYITSFDDYYFSLNPFENRRNPWFREFWEDKFNCTMPIGPRKPATMSTLIESTYDDNETDITTLSPPTLAHRPLCSGKWKRDAPHFCVTEIKSAARAGIFVFTINSPRKTSSTETPRDESFELALKGVATPRIEKSPKGSFE